VAPIRNDAANLAYNLNYNTTTKEVTYALSQSGATGPTGPAGPAGPAGPDGATGPSNASTISVSTTASGGPYRMLFGTSASGSTNIANSSSLHFNPLSSTLAVPTLIVANITCNTFSPLSIKNTSTFGGINSGVVLATASGSQGSIYIQPQDVVALAIEKSGNATFYKDVGVNGAVRFTTTLYVGGATTLASNIVLPTTALSYAVTNLGYTYTATIASDLQISETPKTSTITLATPGVWLLVGSYWLLNETDPFTVSDVALCFSSVSGVAPANGTYPYSTSLQKQSINNTISANSLHSLNNTMVITTTTANTVLYWGGFATIDSETCMSGGMWSATRIG
jgi:hypothetical protein